MRSSIAASKVSAAVVSFLALAAVARAQEVPHEMPGTGGVDRQFGSMERDNVYDNFVVPGLYQCDHVKDAIVVNGDPRAIKADGTNPNDDVYMGPNDYVLADPLDKIHMVNANRGNLWQGTLAQLVQLRDFGLWVRSLIRAAVSALDLTYVEALPLVLSALEIDPYDPQNQWFVEILLAWENEDPDVPPPPPPEE